MMTTSRYPALQYNVLHPAVKDLEVEAAVQQAIDLQLGGLCVPPYWVKKASRDAVPAGISLGTAIGFPFGYQRTEAKVAEMELAFADGAQEVELVINLSALKSQRWNWIKAEIARFAKLVHEREKPLTVLTDAGLLSDGELTRLCKDAADAGADYFKTATGVLTVDTADPVLAFIRQALHPSVGLKVYRSAPSAAEVAALLREGAEQVCATDLSHLGEKE
jgi:deoxyribose-phosphate aldolase